MKISKRKLVLYGAVAVTVAIGLWLGGYSYFKSSDDWSSAQQLISKSEPVTSRVGVQKIALSPLGFYYRFSGDWAQARLSMTVTGDKAEARFRVEMEMANGRWILTQIEAL